MTVKCKFKDGSTGFLNNIAWHPERNPNGYKFSAGLWTFAKELNEQLEEAYDKTYDDIDCVEAPIEIYWHCENDEPWKHFGLLVKELQAGEMQHV